MVLLPLLIVDIVQLGKYILKIQKKTKVNKFYITLICTGGLILLALSFLFYCHQQANKPESGPGASSDFRSEPDKDPPNTIRVNSGSKQVAPNSDRPASPTANGPSGKKQVQMTTSSNVANDTVYIRGGVNYPVSTGSCYALLRGSSGRTIRKDTSLLQNPATTDCKTISIPISDLSSGKWTYTLNYSSDNYEGMSSEASFSI